MTQFRLEIPKLNGNIEEYREYKRGCVEDINSSYNSYKDVDAIWIDPNTQTFIDRTNKDEKALDEYFRYLEEMYNELNKFKSDIEKILDYEGYEGKNSIYEYNSTKIPECKRDLQTVISYLNSALESLDPSAFLELGSISMIYSVRANISAIKSEIEGLIRDIDYVSKKTETALINSRNSRARIEEVDLDIEPTEYNWRIEDAKITEKTVEEVLEGIERYRIGAAGRTTFENKSATGLGDNVEGYTASATGIETRNQDILEGLNAEVKEYGNANVNKINTEDQESVEGLSTGTSHSSVTQRTIETNAQRSVQELNSNVEHREVNRNSIKEEAFTERGVKDLSIERETSGNREGTMTLEKTNINVDNGKTYENNSGASMDTSLIRNSAVDLGTQHYDLGNSRGIDESLMRSSTLDFDTQSFDPETLIKPMGE